MPINRPDGRHWCAPEREQPDENGQWTCPECGKTWIANEDGFGRIWGTAEDHEARKAALEQQPED